MTLARACCCSAGIFALLLAAGCSGGGPVTHSVSGTITYNDKPVADAQVGFVPIDTTGKVKPARGQTDAQGRYTLSTYLGPDQNGSGAMAGSYQVTVEKGLPQNQIVSYEDLKKHKPEIPPSYKDAKTSSLKAEVTPSGPNTFHFTLQDAP